MGNRGILSISTGYDEEVEVAIVDVSGNVVQHLGRIAVNANAPTNMELNTSKLAAGTYLVRITHQEGTKHLKLLHHR